MLEARAMKSQIAEFFANQTVFLTGGGGFLGKVLIEKLLRECSDVSKIYMLMRQKKGKTPQQRVSEVFDFPCFDYIKANNAAIIKKVHVIHGDCQKPDLGLDPEDVRVLKAETTCVIHAAASVRFDQSLKEASYNVRATRDILELAKQMANLKCFIFVSTAYSNPLNAHVKEDFYEPPIEAEKLLNVVNSLDDSVLQRVTPQLLGEWPNTYVYTKSISESLIRSIDTFPIAIIRPGIILSSAKEPMPGWIDNFYGPVGIATGAGVGVLKTFHAKRDAVAAMVPVDYVVNALLSIMWRIGTEKTKTPTVYNFAGHKTNKITWGQFTDNLRELYWIAIPKCLFWYVSFVLRENQISYKLTTFFSHTLFGYIIDFVLFCLGKRTLAVKGYARLHKTLDLIAWFSTRTWDFDDNNILKLWSEMGEEDKKIFDFNMEKLNWDAYLRDSAFGMRYFLLKESLETVPEAKRKLRIMFVAHYAIIILFWFLMYKLMTFMYGLFV
ncbi:fatty acyl-CoA reductase wat [Tribolium castaneum]|uniref:Fatty acyl-CoA reductase n=1 Tax=Tribolium castaneum TaxID=7070 RepID=D6WUD1_TRICA|nr:PREDICTED: fatty acyl-CoA reductase 1 isoform X1 [Tribolium castaneum]EFA07221.2 Putative fatty acyl-CoA reductase CG5065-like Protein [Tribolium castaneum]|eukprot:XP_008192730.1 PREDICTED: fatty acyl-CoA reductase 1 isoform X1 [Tribolium castaneum]